MDNAAATFFDDIIKTFAIESESAKFANISQDVLREFSTDLPGDASAATPAPIPAPNNQSPGTATAPPPTSGKTRPPAADNNALGQTRQATSAPAPSAAIDPFAITPPVVQAPPPKLVPANLAGMDMNSLHQTVRECVLCPLHSERKNVVFGAGSANADLMFIGEWPGKDDDQQGVPFVDEAGQLLTKMINAMQFSRSEVYIANIVKCRPCIKRTAESEEAAACLPYLHKQIELVSPKVIVLLGGIPLKYLMGMTGITKMRGNWLDYNGIKVMPTIPPLYLLRNLHLKKDAWEDLQKVMMFFGKSRSPITSR
ncbi:MAG: uracil-DNA glycosylase [Victivallales bacterium]|nr:uracil-DNA glycosylase [Victivallales bacterium]